MMTPTQDSILLVENDRFMREAIEDILDTVDLSVISVDDGPKGIDAYRAHEDKISLVILDMRLPGMDGAEILLELRAINPLVKVIIASGLEEQEVRRKIADQQDVTFLRKPYKADGLLETVAKLLV